MAKIKIGTKKFSRLSKVFVLCLLLYIVVSVSAYLYGGTNSMFPTLNMIRSSVVGPDAIFYALFVTVLDYWWASLTVVTLFLILWYKKPALAHIAIEVLLGMLGGIYQAIQYSVVIGLCVGLVVMSILTFYDSFVSDIWWL